jgi:predicted small lipoprotein YifL
MRILKSVSAVLALLSLAACGTTQMPLNYAAPATVTRAAGAQPLVDVGQVTLSRHTGREDPLWVGTIRGGYGNPLKALQADMPIDQVVARALREGLRARGLLAEGAGARRRLTVDITQFDANQYVRREATVALRLTLLDAETGRQLWADSVRVYEVDGHLFTAAGVFGSVEELHALSTRVLGQAIDQALDNPAFRAALQPGAGGAGSVRS